MLVASHKVNGAVQQVLEEAFEPHHVKGLGGHLNAEVNVADRSIVPSGNRSKDRH